MPIINHSCIPYLNTLNLVPVTVVSTSDLKELDLFADRNYWVVEFFDRSTIVTLDNYVPDYIINAVKNGEITLLLSNTNEGFYDIVEPIYNKVIIDWDIPEKNVVIVSEAADINIKVNEVAAELGYKPIESWWSRLFEWQAQIQQFFNPGDPYVNNPTLEIKNYNKKFICFNRNLRPHRTAILALLKSKNLLDAGYVSVGPDYDWQRAWAELCAKKPINDKLIRYLMEYNADQFDITPQTLDVDPTNQWYVYSPIGNEFGCQMYRDTYFSVVTETNCLTERTYNRTSRILSEKTFKPMVNGHPFILVSVPHMLKLLRDNGYQTFDGIIDESYDSELDDSTRLLMIADEIARLSALKDDELSLFLTQARKICNHNREHLNSLKNSTSFMTKFV